MPLSAADPDSAEPVPVMVNVDADPFSDWVFREPRQPLLSVRELNDATLKRLLGRFDRLIAGPLPRPGRRLDQAQLVVSPQPGYGKSHLLGRLFAALEGRATLICITPFHSPGLCWQSVLLHVVQELTLPERQRQDGTASPAVFAGADELPTQLDAFAHGVLAHLIAGLIESGKAHHPDPPGAAAWLRENPVEAIVLADPAHPWTQWLHESFELFQRDMEGALRRAGLTLQSPGWLRVLLRYAASLPGEPVRDHCVAWMSGQPLEVGEAGLIGLRAGELTPAETADQINEVCWRRLLDLCQLAAFYRPFVFCFDQTEAYGHSPALARCFGMVIAQIHLMAANEMMVITANQQPWEENIARHLETADKDRFSPLPLEGIRREQAEELVRRRCRQQGVPTAQVEAFLEHEWLATRFPTERNRMGTRQFLQACSARWQKPEEWWQAGLAVTPELPFGPAVPLPPEEDPPSRRQPPLPERLSAAEPVTLSVVPRNEPPASMADQPFGVIETVLPAKVLVLDLAPVPVLPDLAALPAPIPAPAPADLSLSEWHDRYAADLAGNPQRLLYQPDVLRWLVTDVARGRGGLTIEAPAETPRGHLPVTWNLAPAGEDGASCQVHFGFEAGDNWRRWRSILCEVQDRCLPPPLLPAGGLPFTPCKAVFLRTPEQVALPVPGWEIGVELEASKRTCFDVIELEPASVTALYAGRALYLDAAGGDLPYSAAEVMDFLRRELTPLWERIQEPMPGEPGLVFNDAAVAFT